MILKRIKLEHVFTFRNTKKYLNSMNLGLTTGSSVFTGFFFSLTFDLLLVLLVRRVDTGASGTDLELLRLELESAGAAAALPGLRGDERGIVDFYKWNTTSEKKNTK